MSRSILSNLSLIFSLVVFFGEQSEAQRFFRINDFKAVEGEINIQGNSKIVNTRLRLTESRPNE